ncbi:P-loop NTPase [Candidatus Woesearchaeota archaeon]|nr:P-loop NTPase [Candidatus Woesearchaeota archaeon]
MRTIVIASGKGGVGKTTFALNISLALGKYGRQVILIDGNFDSPHIGLMLGKSNFEETIISALEGKDITEVVYKHQSGVKVIAGNISLEHRHKKDIPKFNKLIRKLEEYAEALVIDTSSDTADSIEIIKHATDVILITTPDFISVTETLKLMKVIEQNNQKIVGVIVNKYSGKEYDMKIENIQSLIGQKVIGVVPFHKNVMESLKLKYPVVYSHPQSPATEAFEKIACNMIGVEYKKDEPENKTKTAVVMEKVGLKKWYENLMEEDED